jgi:hypothetical protein
MATNVTEPSVTALVSGILNDVQDLIKQQVTLLKYDIRHDIRQAKEGAVSLGLGIGLAAVGGILLCHMLVHLVQWLAPTWPLWVCYALVGGLLLAAGVGVMFAGKKKFETLNPLPEQSVEAMRENVKWQTATTSIPTPHVSGSR